MAHETASLQQAPSPSGVEPGAGPRHARLEQQNLSMFSFLMSAHRMPVCVSMLLGDTNYLRQQLRLACTTDDAPLQHLALAMLRELAADTSAAGTRNPWSH